MAEIQRAQRVEELRQEAERFMAALAEETYRTRAGLKTGADLSAVFRRHAGLVSEGSARLVDEERAAAAARGEHDEAARLGALHAFFVEELTQAAAKGIADELESREQAARVALTPPGEDAPQEIAFRQVRSELANTPDRARRRALERLELRTIDELTPLYAERHAIVQGVARSLGQPSYRALWESSAGRPLAPLVEAARGFLARTDDMYRETMGWVAKRELSVSLEDVERHDLLAIFRGEGFDDAFAKGALVTTTERFLRDCGLDLRADGRIQLDLEPRPQKSPRAFLAEIEVPGRLVLCLAPQGGRRDWQRFYHELGKALHRAYTDPRASFEHRRLGARSVSEAYGFLWQYLLLDRGFLKRYVGLSRPKDFLFLAHLEKLAYLRRYAAKLCYEAVLGAEASVEGLEELYEEELRKALGFAYPRALFLYDVDPWYLSASYLRAWMLEALFRRHLVHYFDEDWYRNPRCGQFLQQQWQLGQRFDAGGLARDLGYDELTFAPVEERLARSL